MSAQFPDIAVDGVANRLRDEYRTDVSEAAIVDSVARALEGVQLLGLTTSDVPRLVEAAARNEIENLCGDRSSRPRLDPIRAHTRPRRRKREEDG